MKIAERLQRRVGNPLEYSSSAKSMLLLSLSAFMHGQYLFWALYVMGRDDRAELVHLDALRSQMPWFYGIFALTLVLILVISQLRKATGDSLLYEHLAAQYYGLSLCYFSYLTGTLSMPTGAVMAGAPVLGFILFNSRAVLLAMLSAIGVQLLATFGVVQGWWSYAPVVNSPAGDGGLLSSFWMTVMYLFTAPHLLALTAMSYYVLGRWRQREAEVRTLSVTDPLTGLANRRSVLAFLKQERQRSLNQKLPLSVFMLDLDHFKNVNDSRGHPAGDTVLKMVSATLQQVVRQNDIVGRFGGEEFLVVLPGTDLKGAHLLAERCRSALEDHSIPLENGEPLRITASFGVCSNEDQPEQSLEQLLSRADRALYDAKDRGRNRVEVASRAA